MKKEIKNYIIKETFLEHESNTMLIKGRILLGYETNPKNIIPTQRNTVKIYDYTTGLYLGSVDWNEETWEIAEYHSDGICSF